MSTEPLAAAKKCYSLFLAAKAKYKAMPKGAARKAAKHEAEELRKKAKAADAAYRRSKETGASKDGEAGRGSATAAVSTGVLDEASAASLPTVRDARPARRWRILARCRPFSSTELKQGKKHEAWTGEPDVTVDEETGCVHANCASGGAPKHFDCFDAAFGSAATQEDVYRRGCSNIVSQVLRGHEGVILAHGPTGTGKTWSIEGQCASARDSSQRGILPRAAEQIFEALGRRSPDAPAVVTVECCEFYQRAFYDLLADRSGKALRVRKHPETKQVHLEGVSRFVCRNVREVLEAHKAATHKRHVAATAMNATSSRSALLVILGVEMEAADGHGTSGRLLLLDLFGSERVKTVPTVGAARLKESAAINRSLTSFSGIITAMARGNTGRRRHVPWRDSPLWYLLQDPLTTGFAAFLFTMSPSAAARDNTMASLAFARWAAMATFNGPIKIHALENDALLRGPHAARRYWGADGAKRRDDGRHHATLRRYIDTAGLAAMLGVVAAEDKAAAAVADNNNPDVRLLRASWLLQQAGTAELPHRQQLEVQDPESASIFADRGMLTRCLAEVEESAVDGDDPTMSYPGIVVLSYCWQSPAHPDPKGELLAKLGPYLRWYLAERAALLSSPVRVWRCREGGAVPVSSQRLADIDFCVFVDWWSLFQGERTAAQQAAFGRALGRMDEWYGHAGTTSFFATWQPAVALDEDEDAEGGRRRTFDERGWCTFEVTVASLMKRGAHCLDLGARRLPEAFEDERLALAPAALAKLAEAAEVHRWGRPSCPNVLPSLVRNTRRCPLAPDAFRVLLRSKSFTQASDGAAVANLYDRVARAVLGSATRLSYSFVMSWSAPAFAGLGAALGLCANLVRLELVRVGLDGAGAVAMFSALLPRAADEEEEGAGTGAGDERRPPQEGLPKLQVLSLHHNAMGDEGVSAMASAFARGACPRLEQLGAESNGIGDAGVAVLVRRALPELKRLRTVFLNHNAAGSAAQAALRDAAAAQDVDVYITAVGELPVVEGIHEVN